MDSSLFENYIFSFSFLLSQNFGTEIHSALRSKLCSMFIKVAFELYILSSQWWLCFSLRSFPLLKISRLSTLWKFIWHKITEFLWLISKFSKKILNNCYFEISGWFHLQSSFYIEYVIYLRQYWIIPIVLV